LEYLDRIIARSEVKQISDSTITEYMNRLVDFKTRYSCTDSIAAASDWIYDKFLEFGYSEVYYDSFSTDGSYPPLPCDMQWNLVAVKQGSLCPEQVIVVGGHYDSIVIDSNCDPDTLAPGAEDNASGTASILELARSLANVDTDRTLIFVPFAGEEVNAIGSWHFANEAFGTGMDIRAMINLDMVAYTADDTFNLDIWTDSLSIPFAKVFEYMASMYTELIPSIRVDIYSSDNYPFYKLGYNTVSPVHGDWYTHIHDCDDIVEHLSIPYLNEVAKMCLYSTLHIAQMPSTPGDFSVLNIGDGTSLILNWNPVEEPDVIGYNIYYGTYPGEYDSLKVVTTTSDTLRNLTENTTFYLAVAAFDAEGYEGLLSNEIEIEVTSRPLSPINIDATSLDSMINITWESNIGELDLAGYNVYRHPTEGIPDTLLLDFVPHPITIFIDHTAETHLLYAYYVTAVDTQIPPNKSDPTEEVFGQLATHDMGILVIDNTRDGNGAPFSPTDEAVDTFYEELMVEYNGDAVWDVKDSLSVGKSVMDYHTGIYSVILWYSDLTNSTPMASDTTTMRKYLEGGGNLWLSGWKPIESLTGLGQAYYIFDEESFVSHYIGIDSSKTTLPFERDLIGARSLKEEIPSLSVDSVKVFPLGALSNTDIFLTPFSGTYPIYSYMSSDSGNSNYHGMPIAIASYSINYGLIVTDFPLYFMDTETSRLLVRAVMDVFEEPTSIRGDEPERLPLLYSLYQNYPNPFNPTTTISFDIPEENQHVKLTVYDLRGRHVKTLIDSELEPGSHKVVWDGRTEHGNTVSSGVYIYNITSNNTSYSRKMIMLK